MKPIVNRNQVTLIIFPLLLCGYALAQEEETTPPADEWYKSDYALVYDDEPWEKVDEIVSYYADTIHDHDDGGVHSSHEWMSGLIEEWKINGWIRSELADLEYTLLNPTTASFMAKWRDYYSGGNISYECAWYLADFDEGRWQITEYASINCGEHGL